MQQTILLKEIIIGLLSIHLLISLNDSKSWQSKRPFLIPANKIFKCCRKHLNKHREDSSESDTCGGFWSRLCAWQNE